MIMKSRVMSLNLNCTEENIFKNCDLSNDFDCSDNGFAYRRGRKIECFMEINIGMTESTKRRDCVSPVNFGGACFILL